MKRLLSKAAKRVAHWKHLGKARERSKKTLHDSKLFLARAFAHAYRDFFKFTTITLTKAFIILKNNVLQGGCSNLEKWQK